MKGDHALIALRMDGYTPKGVWISHAPTPDWNTWDKSSMSALYPELQILPTENPAALDLRLVVGLTVHVSGCPIYSKAKRLHEALIASGAHRVITTCGSVIIDSEHGEWDDYVPE